MQRKREQAKSVELAAAVMPDSPAAGMLPNQKIEFWRIEDVIPYDRNPRVNDDAVQAVANSIRDHGFMVSATPSRWIRTALSSAGTPASKRPDGSSCRWCR